MTGVFLDQASLDRDDLDLSALEATLPEWRIYPATSPAQVAERIAEAQVVVCNKVVLDAADIAAAPHLKLIAVTATGTNNIDLEAARARGITVCNARGYATASVVQHLFALLLTLVTRLDDYRAAVRAGRWNESEQFCLLDYPIAELGGRTLGIVGYGELGRGVAQVAEQAFGMRVLLARRPGGEAQAGRLPLAELLPQVDVLSLHCPLTEQTRDLIGAEELARMKPGAILLNTARGGIVDEPALADALRRGHLGGAGVDVLSVEPPREGNPLLAEDIPNLIVTPHIAWASREARQRLMDDVTANVAAWREGRPRNTVT